MFVDSPGLKKTACDHYWNNKELFFGPTHDRVASVMRKTGRFIPTGGSSSHVRRNRKIALLCRAEGVGWFFVHLLAVCPCLFRPAVTQEGATVMCAKLQTTTNVPAGRKWFPADVGGRSREGTHHLQRLKVRYHGSSSPRGCQEVDIYGA